MLGDKHDLKRGAVSQAAVHAGHLLMLTTLVWLLNTYLNGLCKMWLMWSHVRKPYVDL